MNSSKSKTQIIKEINEKIDTQSIKSITEVVNTLIEVITEALKHGGITNMMDRLSNPAKIVAFDIAEELKEIMTPLFQKHMDDIMSGEFSKEMMMDWENNDKNL